MSKFLKHYCIDTKCKSCKKSVYVFFLKFGHFTQNLQNSVVFFTLEMIILVRAINKYFQKNFENIKTSFKQANNTSLKMNINLT